MRQGIVIKDDYDDFLRGALFSRMKVWSDRFVSENRSLLDRYQHRWVRDPLHQWSRRWEYPFVYSELMAHAAESPVTKVVDAGAGFTFLPFMLKQSIGNVELVCIDQDPQLDAFYSQAKCEAGCPTFQQGSLSALDMESSSVDVVYCISVLEHTSNYDVILGEFLRVLKPGGRLIFTFDLSLDGFSDIPVEAAFKLCNTVAALFDGEEWLASFPASADALPPGMLRTDDFLSQPDLLPWKFPRLSGALASIRAGHWPRLRMKSLACACFSVRKAL